MPIPFRLLILTPGFPRDESDTTCIPALQDFVLGWKEFHPEIQMKVISFQYPHEEKFYRWNGIEVYAAGGKDRKLFFRQRTWRRVNNKLKEWCNNQTILLSYFLTEATFVGLKFSLRENIPHLAIAAGQDVKKQNRYLEFLRITQPKIVCFNQSMSEELFQSAGVRADYIIPMGISDSNGLFPRYHGINRQLDLLIAGSLIPVKQVDLALKIISEVKKDFSFLKTEIVGDGTERKNLEALTKELHLESTVHFTGALKREQVFDKMQQAKILLHASEYEGQSTVISEALACGMSVVCFDVGRICDHEKIHVCRSAEEMTRKVIQLLTENSFDFSSVVPVTMRDTINAYWSIIKSF
ncbi:MAG TPA: glycosyltransferase family 4 protein [Chitinophagales bacterium]|nr:glycosyltransferase family 4 protein [Chitinophagales bacterium]